MAAGNWAGEGGSTTSQPFSHVRGQSTAQHMSAIPVTASSSYTMNAHAGLLQSMWCTGG